MKSRRPLSLRKATAKRDTNKKPKARITKKRTLKAIEGSGGIATEIVKRLDCSPFTYYTTMRRPDWEPIRIALQVERDRVGDLAEDCVQFVIKQRGDLKAAANMAKWYLERKHTNRGFGKKSEITLEGGQNPLKVNHLISVEGLPLAVRKLLLMSIEALEKPDGK